MSSFFNNDRYFGPFASVLLCIIFFCIMKVQATESCISDMNTYRDVVACAESRSLEIQMAIAGLNKSKAEVSSAGEWKNPEISATTVWGKENGQSNSQTDLDLGIPIELGGKVSARREVAEGGVAESEVKIFELRAKIRSEVLLKLHRLRQIFHEQEIVDEAIGTFSKLVTQFSKRPTLSPEMRLSVSVFRMSKSEYEIKRAEIIEELISLRSYFKISVGKEVEELRKLTPESPKKWPDLQQGYNFGISPKSKLVQAEVQASRASLSLANSEAWPTLTIGPTVQFQKQGRQSEQMFGLNLSFPLPVFNLNGGARAAAAIEVSRSETKKNYIQVEEEKEREALIGIYNESKRVLQKTLSHNDMEGRHKEIESLFFKGVVPSALVIEAHRTFIDLEISRNQRELKAINSLLSIYTIDGKILELE